MLRLLTFGGLRVARDDGGTTELANQRRRLAVLAAAAAASPGGIARDKLLFLLWPDADADKGRHALNQIVYNLRRELGASPIDGVTELTLLPDVMSADLIEFRAAIARGDHAAAAALYAGPFLDGFYVPGATEFERWAEEERARTTRQVIAAIDKLAQASATDPAGLVHWTGRLVELDPLSARRALTHMRALELLGDRDAAIAYGRRYVALAGADGDDVDPVVDTEVERLRAMPTIVPFPVAPLQPAAADYAVSLADDGGTAVALAPEPIAPAIESPERVEQLAPAAPPAPVARPQLRWRVPAALLAIVVAVGAAVAWSRSQHPVLPLGVGDQMLLADVQMPDDDSSNARALTLALQSAMQQSARVRLVSPAAISDALQRMERPTTDLALPEVVALEVAEREGARYVVGLQVAKAGASRLLTLRVFDPASRTAIQSYTASAPDDALLPTLDALVARFRHDLGDTKASIASAVLLPRATTGSLEALRMYASGRDAFRRSLFNDARTLYQNAVALDSGFAAAHAGIAAVEYELGNVPLGDSAIATALALAGRLAPRERLLIEAEAERGRGDWIRAATLHRAYLIRYPDDYDVYEMLAYDLTRGKNPDEAMVAFDTVRAHRRLSAPSLLNIAQINILLGRHQAARAAFGEAMHLDTTLLIRNIENERFGTTFMRLGFNDSARTVFNVMLARDASDQARGHRSLAMVDLLEGRYASAVAHFRAAVELGQQQDGGGQSEIRDRALLASALIELGRIPAAREQLRVGSALALSDPYAPALLLWTGKPAARIGDTTLARQLLDAAKARTRESNALEMASTTALEAELLVAQGRMREGVAAAERAVAIDSAAYLVETLAYALEQAGRLTEARAKQELLAQGLVRQMGKEAQQMALFAPLAVARLDAELGREADAARIVNGFAERWSSADANLPMITTLRARIAAKRAK